MSHVVGALTSRKLCANCNKRLFRTFASLTIANPLWRGIELPKPRLNYQAIVENVDSKISNALSRKAPIQPADIRAIAETYSNFKRLSSSINSQRNQRSLVGQKVKKALDSKDDKAKEAVLAEAKSLKENIQAEETMLAQAEEKLYSLAFSLPNDTHPSVPAGDAQAAVTIRTWGPDPAPAATERDHVKTGQQFGLINLEDGANVTGTSWYYLTGIGALLELALINYAVSVAIAHGWTPVRPPDVVRLDVANRCGFHPRDHSDPPMSQMYYVDPSPLTQSPELVLSATAEIPLAGMFANKIFSLDSLPLKVVGVGQAFRAEAGARGADTRGLYRVHQFSKVELFSVVANDKSEDMMEEMRSLQEKILDGLGLPLRTLDMPTEELGASAYRKYDIEAWMPGRGRWGEISSLSNCTDYQSRRLLIRYAQPSAPDPSTHANVFAHTLNGTAAAVPRLIVALLENRVNLRPDGTAYNVKLPKALQPFWLGKADESQGIIWET